MTTQPPLFPDLDPKAQPVPAKSGRNPSPPVDQMYQDWFLDYASYVILDRAIPRIEDGLKPVQRRLLYAMAELDDGRYNKAANIIGHTMRYHPHGDMAISDALVKVAQKELLIDMQGNWGNPTTGDSAAASRYIEGRLTQFARDVLFSPDVTTWQASYDARNKEPVTLPAKFPILLYQGVEGIAVGLSTKILPHNFCELIRESINVLRGFRANLVPDFPSGGVMDVSNYEDGQRGGRVRVRAVIDVLNSKTLVVREIPYGTTTSSLIDSILAANDKGKLKVKKVEDNTAEHVEIVIHLAAGASADLTIGALYAFTDCEVSIAPNACVIVDGKPRFISVSTLLEDATLRTRKILGEELEIRLDKLLAKLHFADIERIFIEERIYRKIENSESWEGVVNTIKRAFATHAANLRRPLSNEDIEALCGIKIRRISRYDHGRAESQRLKLAAEVKEVKGYLANLTQYTIEHYKGLLKTYGTGRKRRTKVEEFGRVKAAAVAVANLKLYCDAKQGFIGTSLKQDAFVADCSEHDDVIVLRKDCNMQLVKVSAKAFVGKHIAYANVFQRNDEHCLYHIVYQDKESGSIYAKRCTILSANRDRDYFLGKDAKSGAKLLYLSVNPAAEAETVRLHLKPAPRLRRLEVDIDFAQLLPKSRTAAGVMITKHSVSRVEQLHRGGSTVEGQRLWFDQEKNRLNTEEDGRYAK